MKWVGVSGSWRRDAPGLREDVRREVRAVLEAGDGIVTGGALGVDYVATEAVLEFDGSGSRLRVILPSTFAVYRAHYLKRADEGVITHEQAEGLIEQLEKVRAVGALEEMGALELNAETYNQRSQAVVDASERLLVFQVNRSAGTQFVIERAGVGGKPVKLFSYQVA